MVAVDATFRVTQDRATHPYHVGTLMKILKLAIRSHGVGAEETETTLSRKSNVSKLVMCVTCLPILVLVKGKFQDGTSTRKNKSAKDLLGVVVMAMGITLELKKIVCASATFVSCRKKLVIVEDPSHGGFTIQTPTVVLSLFMEAVQEMATIS
mmetsp:Transcript_21692/g.33114  ORF Transcript_21692/g.33114 Transcript_21692/m.33114 type:complete len:153 (+) Transcript_21692:813-1271(+)